MEVRLLIAAFRRRLLLIIAFGIVGALVGLTLAQRDEVEYQATAQLLLDPTAIVVPGTQPFTGDPERFVGGQIGVLRSRATATRAAELVGVSADDVGETLVVERIVGSDVVDVIGRSGDPQLARDVANAVAETYVAQRREQSAASVAAQVAAVQKEIAAVQQQLAALPTTTDAPNPRQQAVVGQYQELLDRQLRLTAPGAVRDASAVLDPARLPEDAERLSPLLAGAAGTALGLLLGTALALMLEGRRPHVINRMQVEQLLNRPVRTTVAAKNRRADHGEDARAAARVLLAFIRTHPVPGRRAIAVCATGTTGALDRLAGALIDVEVGRGRAAELVQLGSHESLDAVGTETTRRRIHVGQRRDAADTALGQLLVESSPTRRAADAAEVLRALPQDLDVAVFALPNVLDDPSVADVAQWATDIVLLVPLDQQGEHELALAHELLTSGPALLHPVLVSKRAGRSR